MPLVLLADAGGTAEAAWLAQTNKDGELETIGFYSKSFSQTMRRQGHCPRGPRSHFRTAGRASVRALVAIPGDGVHRLPAPHICEGSTRSELSSRWLDKLQDIRYKLVYERGRDNEVADAFSRLDLHGPDLLSAAGTAPAIDDLLEHLEGTTAQRARSVWIHVADYTDEACKATQIGRGRAGMGNLMSKSTPTPEALAAHHDLRILRFDPHIAVELTRQVLLSDSPAAILLPLDITGSVGADQRAPQYRASSRPRGLPTSEHMWVATPYGSCTASTVLRMTCASLPLFQPRNLPRTRWCLHASRAP